MVTGPTGSGKNTTLAAFIDFINRNWYRHVITIEDPIEYIHESKKCLMSQRAVYQHTLDFKNPLYAALRQDPDAILMNELRDLETIQLALTGAETGHLVFATLHMSSAEKAIHRVFDGSQPLKKQWSKQYCETLSKR